MKDDLYKRILQSKHVHIPMEERRENSGEFRWMQKPVLAERQISLAHRMDDIRLIGPGLLAIDRETCHTKGGGVRLEYPTVQKLQNPSGRAYSISEIRVPFPCEDWRDYNRISVSIYVASENSAINNVTLYLYNQGPVEIPVPGRFEGYHSVTVKADQWKRILWEIPHLCREQVTGLGMAMLAAGVSYPGNERVTVFFDDLRLERVDADPYKGFDIREGCIAYSHSGYHSIGRKQALIQQQAESFSLLDEYDNAVFTDCVCPLEDGFFLLDFSAFHTPGWYTIRVGSLCSRPFPIGPEAFLSSIWKSLNFFYAERCGCAVQGSHSECHLDVMSKHPDGRLKCVAGGWHDAGDLTQDGRNTMECTLAMLETVERAQNSQPSLSDRMLEEARWGLDWMMRIRWGDGMRHCGRIIAFWTDNAQGTTDDVVTQAENRPYDNLLSAQVFAKAAQVIKQTDPMYAALCGRLAREDFIFGAEWVGKQPTKSFSFATQLQLNAQAALSACELYRFTGERKYLDDAVGYARIIMRCQITRVPDSFSKPVTGYFFETEEQKREQTYFHRSYEHVPVQALCELLRLCSDHPDGVKWRESVSAYGGYLKATVDLTPYGVAAAGVYQPDNADFSNMYHEGDRSRGAPSMAEYNEQVYNGFQLDSTHYLRVFPVAYQFRGYHAIVLSKAIAAMEVAELLDDCELVDIARRQLEWIVGFNPFACSGQYGEGYDYHPLYTGLQPQIVGALPVGYESFENEDIPYYPLQAIATYNEIWVHTTCRMMKAVAYMNFPLQKENESEGASL